MRSAFLRPPDPQDSWRYSQGEKTGKRIKKALRKEETKKRKKE
jgi:hypothetical protein